MKNVSVKTNGWAFLLNEYMQVGSLRASRYLVNYIRIEVETSKGNIAKGRIAIPKDDFIEFCWQCLIAAEEITQYEREQAQSKTAFEVIAIYDKLLDDKGGYDDEFFEIMDAAEEER